jgi:hypothetical protein
MFNTNTIFSEYLPFMLVQIHGCRHTDTESFGCRASQNPSDQKPPDHQFLAGLTLQAVQTYCLSALPGSHSHQRYPGVRIQHFLFEATVTKLKSLGLGFTSRDLSWSTLSLRFLATASVGHSSSLAVFSTIGLPHGILCIQSFPCSSVDS